MRGRGFVVALADGALVGCCLAAEADDGVAVVAVGLREVTASVWGVKTRCAPEKSVICRQDAIFGTEHA